MSEKFDGTRPPLRRLEHLEVFDGGVPDDRPFSEMGFVPPKTLSSVNVHTGEIVVWRRHHGDCAYPLSNEVPEYDDSA